MDLSLLIFCGGVIILYFVGYGISFIRYIRKENKREERNKLW